MKIALLYTGTHEKHNYYTRWLQAGESLEVVRLWTDDNNLHELAGCVALVLSGGRDIHPRNYNSARTDYPEAPGRFDVQRDEFEAAAFRLAQERGLPVLGICRGMQLINCVMGGTLHQDLGAELNQVHRATTAEDKWHGVRVERNTLLHELVQAEHSRVNSAHHQAVDMLGQGLRVNCRAADGTIEGFEWADATGRPFLLGVQWHPERMFRGQQEEAPLARGIRNRFIEAIKQSTAHHENH